jgi:protein gp37
MKSTKIDWADSSWNPVTGCYHDCTYCYARKIANRFGEKHHAKNKSGLHELVAYDGTRIDLKTPFQNDFDVPFYPVGWESPYPFGFEPTFHRYRLDEPAKMKKSRNIFVCSMADLFGEWIPDEWIRDVFGACEKAPQHRYLFLTKNPERYCKLADVGKLPELDNFWYGSTITKPGESMFAGSIHWNTFLSIEPLLAPIDVGIGSFGGAKWIIVGAETGNRAGKVIPERAWVEKIIDAARMTGAAVFLKNSLLEVMEGEFIQEYPWEV